MTDRLEAATGVPHLNFGMAHFSPYQSLLVYRHLAKEFEHSVVMIGILPENDFVDLDLESARNFPDYEYRYRPYLLESASGYEHFDYRENALLRWLRRNSYAYQAVKAAASRLGFAAAPPDPAARKGSRFYDFSEGDVRRLEFILDELRSEAGNRELVVLLLPVARDLRRYERDGADPLSQRLGAWAARSKVTLVNLLPPLAKAASASEAIAFACDYHWNAKAHAAAVRVVRRRLAERFYSALAAGNQGRSAR